MSGLFNIPIGGLKEGHYIYNFDINNRFFDKFEESEIKEGELIAVVEADRRATHIDLNIKIDGKVIVSCDRCLGAFSQPVSCGNRLLVKFGEKEDDNDPDIITLPADEADLDLSQYFYEYILLALPIQKIHPDDAYGNSTCDPGMLIKLKEHIINEDNKYDPRWDELRKLVNNN